MESRDWDIARAHIVVGHLDDAIEYLQDHGHPRPRSMDYYLMLAKCYLNKGWNDAAIDTLCVGLDVCAPLSMDEQDQVSRMLHMLA